MSRKRHQQGNLKVVRGRLIAQWWEGGHRRNKVLGKVGKVTKSQAQDKLAEILAPINTRLQGPSEDWKFGDFVSQVYLPWYKRKWKSSTTDCNTDRLEHHVSCEFEGRTLRSFTRGELQDFLDRKSTAGLSFSTVDHLRWDLKQIFDMAVAEGHIRLNPAVLLFVSKAAKRRNRLVMSIEEVAAVLKTLAVRERLIASLRSLPACGAEKSSP